MPTITAVVHTKNSAKTLESCLESLPWCDEVFVVDMESSDETIAIAKKYKTTIFHEKQIQFADPVRDKYLQKVKTDWTIIVDSDEEIPKTLAEKISELMMTAGIDGYNLPRKNIIFGKWIEHTGFWPDYILRLFRTGKGIYPPTVHSQPHVAGRVENVTAQADFAILHHHYDSIEQFLMRLNVYTSLEVEKRKGESSKKYDFLKAFFDQFFTRFFAEKGYKDGVHGLTLSLLMGVYMMVVQMKLWERQKEEFSLTLDDVEHSINDGCAGTMYWVANEKIMVEKNILKRIVHTLRRRIHSTV